MIFNHRLIATGILLVGAEFLFGQATSSSGVTATYIGSTACRACHSGIYER